MPPIRTKRAKRACSFCNGRRIKCNAMEAMPCHNCVAANADCHIKESARGKWPRRHKGMKILADGSAALGVDDCPRDEPTLPSTGYEPSHGRAESAGGGDSVDQGCRIAVRQDNELYLGESTLLRAVHDHRPEPGFQRIATSSLRYPLPAIVAMPEWEHRRRERRLETLTAEGAMNPPDRAVQDILFEAYFVRFHVCFPVVDRESTLDQSRAGLISPMLLQAMMFIGVIHCNADKLRHVGFNTGDEARHLFYNRAKDLYDADFESDSLIQLQTMFLLSFWRAGPLLQKDCRHWLGSAIAMAQKKGMHRSFGNLAPTPDEMGVGKRIWWSIYIRERQCAAALGLPNRIRDEDCDVTPLTAADFNISETSEPAGTLFGLMEMNYVIEMATLASFLGKIVCNEYTPHSNHSSLDRTHLRGEIEAWYQQLPESLRLDSKVGSLHVGMLHMAHNNLLILLSRRAFVAEPHEPNQHESQIAYWAACQISRIAEDLLADDVLGHGQIHVMTCLFNALCIHTVTLRRVKGTSRLVAEHRAKICLYGLRELQKTWEVTNWILKLFFQHLDRSVARLLETKEREDDDHKHAPPADGSMAWSSRTMQAPISPIDSLDHFSDLGLAIPLPWEIGQDPAGLIDYQGQDESWANAIACLDGITSVDLELLAGCLT